MSKKRQDLGGGDPLKRTLRRCAVARPGFPKVRLAMEGAALGPKRAGHQMPARMDAWWHAVDSPRSPSHDTTAALRCRRRPRYSRNGGMKSGVLLGGPAMQLHPQAHAHAPWLSGTPGSPIPELPSSPLPARPASKTASTVLVLVLVLLVAIRSYWYWSRPHLRYGSRHKAYDARLCSPSFNQRRKGCLSPNLIPPTLSPPPKLRTTTTLPPVGTTQTRFEFRNPALQQLHALPQRHGYTSVVLFLSVSLVSALLFPRCSHFAFLAKWLLSESRLIRLPQTSSLWCFQHNALLFCSPSSLRLLLFFYHVLLPPPAPSPALTIARQIQKKKKKKRETNLFPPFWSCNGDGIWDKKV